MSDSIMETEGTETSQTQETSKTYTQEEMDRHIAGMKNSLTRKFEKQFADLGDVDELRTLKSEAEQRKTQEQIKRGEFEKTLGELADKKNNEIAKRDNIIKDYRVNTPLLDAAARYKAVAPEQVKKLLASNVRLNDTGEVEVVDVEGNVRYTEDGKPVGVDTLVQDFLKSNPHFVQPTPATTHTQTNTGTKPSSAVSLDDLDMTNPEHRKIYKDARNKGLI